VGLYITNFINDKTKRKMTNNEVAFISGLQGAVKEPASSPAESSQKT
jgi:hypothetical protein